MNKKKKLLLIISIILLLTALIIGGTVAFFGWRAEEEATVDVTIASGSGSCTLRSDNEKLIEPTEDRYGGRIIRLNAKQEIGEKALITWNLVVNEINGLEDKTFKYELINYTTGASYGSGTFEGVTSNSEISFSNNNDVLGFNREYMFILYLWIDGTIGNNLLTMADQEFNFDMNCNMVATDTGVVENENIMMSVLSTDADAETDVFLRKNEEGQGLLRSEIGSVTFTKNINVPEGNTQIDVSQNEDNSVVMWYGEANSDNKYDVYIGGNNGKVIINSGFRLLRYLTNVKAIDFAGAVNTSAMNTMNTMFSNCTNLTSINFDGIETFNVTEMTGLFQRCDSLVNLDLSNFDTSKVTVMRNMFSFCLSLITLDLSNFDISNVIDISNMFSVCQSIEELDLSDFDTSSVTTMNEMFNRCYSLKYLNLNNFDTSKVTNMYAMFQGCYALTTLDLSGFNTSNVTTMEWMFNNCTGLISLDISNFDTSKVTCMSHMFNNCNKLKSLDISNFDTSSVNNTGYIDNPGMYKMFADCKNLVVLDLSNFDTNNVTNMYGMFYHCTRLNKIYVSDLWNTDVVTNSADMFYGCTSLIGSLGTIYNSNYIDKRYARVDGGTASPGYFTYKAASA